MTTGRDTLATYGETSPAALHHDAAKRAGGGAECKDGFSPGFSSRGKYFLLTFPFIERQGGRFRSGPRTIWITAPIVNASVLPRIMW